MSETTTDYNNGQDECFEQSSSLGPVLEEFIPIKRINEDEDEEEDEQQLNQLNNKSKVISSKSDKSSSKKSDWLRHAQLSIQSPDPLELSPKRVPVVEVTRNGCGAFHPLRKEKSSDEAPAVGNVKLLVAPAVEPAVAAAPRRRVLAVVVVVVVVGEKVKMKGSRIGKLDGVSRQNGIDSFFMLFNNSVVHMLLHLNKFEN
ncbi:transcription factor HHO3 [Helianthus annuus]|uniref:transcription factor HHO3 n=1 Tax=Helianthus annuus TaxID=4232 RepID=UPI001652C6FC|nr:transcription factor HHO3 [Helianthus annuus]